jgi:hypothetical protein
MKIFVATFRRNSHLYLNRVRFRETLFHLYLTPRCHIPEDGNFHNYGRENLKCCDGQSFPTRNIECNLCRVGVIFCREVHALGKEEGIIVTMVKVKAILSVYLITRFAMRAYWGMKV